MPYDPKLHTRIQKILSRRTDVVEKKMFGSVAFMVHGHMTCGPLGNNLIIRIGDEAAARAIKEPHVKPMNFTGKVMKSFAMIEPNGMKSEPQLRRWVEMAVAYATSTPPAKKKRPALHKKAKPVKRSKR